MQNYCSTAFLLLVTICSPSPVSTGITQTDISTFVTSLQNWHGFFIKPSKNKWAFEGLTCAYVERRSVEEQSDTPFCLENPYPGLLFLFMVDYQTGTKTVLGVKLNGNDLPETTLLVDPTKYVFEEIAYALRTGEQFYGMLTGRNAVINSFEKALDASTNYLFTVLLKDESVRSILLASKWTFSIACKNTNCKVQGVPNGFKAFFAVAFEPEVAKPSEKASSDV